MKKSIVIIFFLITTHLVAIPSKYMQIPISYKHATLKPQKIDAENAKVVSASKVVEIRHLYEGTDILKDLESGRVGKSGFYIYQEDTIINPRDFLFMVSKDSILSPYVDSISRYSKEWRRRYHATIITSPLWIAGLATLKSVVSLPAEYAKDEYNKSSIKDSRLKDDIIAYERSVDSVFTKKIHKSRKKDRYRAKELSTWYKLVHRYNQRIMSGEVLNSQRRPKREFDPNKRRNVRFNVTVFENTTILPVLSSHEGSIIFDYFGGDDTLSYNLPFDNSICGGMGLRWGVVVNNNIFKWRFLWGLGGTKEWDTAKKEYFQGGSHLNFTGDTISRNYDVIYPSEYKHRKMGGFFEYGRQFPIIKHRLGLSLSFNIGILYQRLFTNKGLVVVRRFYNETDDIQLSEEVVISDDMINPSVIDYENNKLFNIRSISFGGPSAAINFGGRFFNGWFEYLMLLGTSKNDETNEENKDIRHSFSLGVEFL